MYSNTKKINSIFFTAIIILACFGIINSVLAAAAPTVETNEPDGSTAWSVNMNGVMTNTGGHDNIERGFEWGTSSSDPGEYSNWWTETGDFGVEEIGAVISHSIGGLVPGQIYYYRFKSLNSDGWGYGDEKTFTTDSYTYPTYDYTYYPSGIATSPNILDGLSVAQISSFGYTAAVFADTTIKVQFSQDGSVWKSSDGTLDGWNTCVDGSNSIDLATLNWTGPNFYYRFELIANAAQTVTPEVDSISVTYSELVLPTVATNDHDTVTAWSANMNGQINDTGGDNNDERGFEWGTASGVYTSWWEESGSFTPETFSHSIGGLVPGQIYYYRAKSHNTVGWGYGDEKTFTTDSYTYPTYDYTYYPSGIATSPNILDGLSVAQIYFFDYTATVPAGTTLRVQFSELGINWYDSNGTPDGWNTCSTGVDKSIDLVALMTAFPSWNGPNFYYRFELTSNATQTDTPEVDSVSVIYSGPVYVPNITGDTAGEVDTDYELEFISGFVSGITDLHYGIDWNNDGDLDDPEDEWVPSSGYVSPGIATSTVHQWAADGVYVFRALTEDDLGFRSDWSDWYTMTIGEINDPPNPPTVAGPNAGIINTDYEFGFVSNGDPWVSHEVVAGADDQEVRSIIYNGRYIAAGTDDNDVNSSGQDIFVWEQRNPETWIPRVVDTAETHQSVGNIIYNSASSKYVIGGMGINIGTNDALVWESEDLEEWTQRHVSTGGLYRGITSILYNTGDLKYVAVGKAGEAGEWNALAWESEDLEEWTQRTVDDDTGNQYPESLIYNAVSGTYVAAGYEYDGDNDAVVWKSEDLEIWIQRTVDDGAGDQKIYSIIHDPVNNRYVAAGEEDGNAVVWESEDLETSWVQHDVDTGTDEQHIYSIIYDSVNDKYVAGGYEWTGVSSAVTWESLDLITWTRKDVGTANVDLRVRFIVHDTVVDRYVAGGAKSNGLDEDAAVWVVGAYEQLQYGVDWDATDADDSVDEWTPFPFGTYTDIGTYSSSTHNWASATSTTFQVLAEDDGGLRSDWTIHDITIAINATPTATIILPNTNEPDPEVLLRAGFADDNEDDPMYDECTIIRWYEGDDTCSDSDYLIHEEDPANMTADIHYSVPHTHDFGVYGTYHLYLTIKDSYGGWSDCKYRQVVIKPECSDGEDNYDGFDEEQKPEEQPGGWFDDGDTGSGASTTLADPSCFDYTNTDFINLLFNPATTDEQILAYFSSSTLFESNNPQCSDGVDNDDDGLIDEEDSGCHTNYIAASSTTYSKFLNQERTCGVDTNGVICDPDETFGGCPIDCSEQFQFVEF